MNNEKEKDMKTSSYVEPTTKPKDEAEKNEHPKHSKSEFVVDQKSTPEEEPDSEITTEQRVDVANDHQVGHWKKEKQN